MEKEKRRELTLAPINIHIASSLSASVFQGATSPSARASGSSSSDGGGGGSPRWALNIHQFPADICVTSALQPGRRVSAIGNANAGSFFFSSSPPLPPEDFFGLSRAFLAPSLSRSCFVARNNPTLFHRATSAFFVRLLFAQRENCGGNLARWDEAWEIRISQRSCILYRQGCRREVC